MIDNELEGALPVHPRTGLRAVGIVGGKPVWPILGASDDDPSNDDGGDDPDTGDDTDDDDEDDDEPLGPPGVKALEAMKEKRRKAIEARRTAEAENTRLRGELAKLAGGKPPEPDTAAADKEAKANQKIIRSEVKALARDILVDPDDAHLFIDLGQIEVDDDGDVVDSEKITAALKAVAKKKPHLAAKKFQGGADTGPRDPSKPEPTAGLGRMRAAYETSAGK